MTTNVPTRTHAAEAIYDRAVWILERHEPMPRRIGMLVAEIEHLDERGLPGAVQLAHRTVLALAREFGYDGHEIPASHLQLRMVAGAAVDALCVCACCAGT